MAALAMNHTSTPPKMVLEVIRDEGLHGGSTEAHKIGFRYAISVLGTAEDYKRGHIVIRRKWRGGGEVTFPEILHSYRHAGGVGYSEAEAEKIFSRRRRREYVLEHGRDAPVGYVEKLWEAFKLGDGEKLQMPKFAGGRVGYHALLSAGKTEAEIESEFHKWRRKPQEREGPGLGKATYDEFQKLIADWDYAKYLQGGICEKFSSELEAHSTPRNPPDERTSFCTLVGRMMQLTQLNHGRYLMKQRQTARKAQKVQKKIANDKRCTKYNTMKEKLGTSAFNAMKVRDQATKEKNAAAKVATQSDTVSRFVQWRTQTRAGLGYDKAPSASYVRTFSTPWHSAPEKQVHLGYASRRVLAELVKKCVSDRATHTQAIASGSSYMDMCISFKPDPTRAETQLYQYAAIQDRGALQLGKTRDVNWSRVFKITGYHTPRGSITSRFATHDALYVNLDNMTNSVYYSLPQQWKEFEEWSGFDIKGNPKRSAMMKTLFKIVDSNIESFSFVKDKVKYSVGFTTNARVQKCVSELLRGVKSKYDTAAAAAALLAEEDKRRRAQEARAAQRAKAARKKNGMTYFPTSDKTKKSVKAMLAQQLAEGKIDVEAFKMGMSALD